MKPPRIYMDRAHADGFADHMNDPKWKWIRFHGLRDRLVVVQQAEDCYDMNKMRYNNAHEATDWTDVDMDQNGEDGGNVTVKPLGIDSEHVATFTLISNGELLCVVRTYFRPWSSMLCDPMNTLRYMWEDGFTSFNLQRGDWNQGNIDLLLRVQEDTTVRVDKSARLDRLRQEVSERKTAELSALREFADITRNEDQPVDPSGVTGVTDD